MGSSGQTKYPSIILYIWPGQWELPSFDPLCLAAVLYLQLAIPGQFGVIECSNPDAPPTGVFIYALRIHVYSLTVARTATIFTA